MSILVVAALGNPGRDYADTRHNFGWLVLDAFARQQGLEWKEQPRFMASIAKWDRPGKASLWLVKPLTFMNESGVALGAFLRFHKADASRLLVLYDDLTMDLGLTKVSVQGSSGGHNGVASLLEHVGQGFVRFRLGIGPKFPREMDLKDYVLGCFTSEQAEIVKTNLERNIQGLDLLLNEGVEKAMNHLNRRNPK